MTEIRLPPWPAEAEPYKNQRSASTPNLTTKQSIHSIINLEMPAGFHNEQTLATPSNHVLSLEPWTPNWWILPVLSVLSNVTGTRSVKRWMTWRRLCLNWMSSWHSWNTSVAPHGPERSDWHLWAYAGRTQSKHFRVWLRAPRKVLWWSRGHNDHSVFN